MNAILLVFIGGGVGSVLRYSLGLIYPAKLLIPTGTFLANVISCLLLGVLIGFQSKQWMSDGQKLLLVTGFCGGFSTFSTFSSEMLQMMQSGDYLWALGYSILSLVAGIIAILIGMMVARWIGLAT